MAIQLRVKKDSLSEIEEQKFERFISGREYCIPANMPHFIVGNTKRAEGIVIGMNSRKETKRYSYPVMYKSFSEKIVFCYYDSH